MKDLTPLLVGAGIVYLFLQAQKTQKGGGDTFIDQRRTGARHRVGRIADNAAQIAEDAKNWACDNLPWVPWDCSA
jgi:hypothetical protein